MANRNTTLVSNRRTQVFSIADPPPELEHRTAAARPAESTATAARRATYKSRRRSAPYPSQDPSPAELPAEPTEEDTAVEETRATSPSVQEIEEEAFEEVEEEIWVKAEPESEEEEEVEVGVEVAPASEAATASNRAPTAPAVPDNSVVVGAAASAPQPILQATPKQPSVLRGSIGRFLDAESASPGDRSRSRGKAPPAPTSANKQPSAITATSSSNKQI